MAIWIHNQSGQNKTYAGTTIPDDSFYQIPDTKLRDFGNSKLLIQDLLDFSNGVKISLDGVNDRPGAEMDHINALKGTVQPQLEFAPNQSFATTAAPHSAEHAPGQSDPLDLTNFPGLLADPQVPISHTSTHQSGGSDEISIQGLLGRASDPQPFNQSEILALPETQLALNYQTHSNANDPSADQKAAMDAALSPNSTNAFLTKSKGDSDYATSGHGHSTLPTLLQKQALDAATGASASNPFMTAAQVAAAVAQFEENATALLARVGDPVGQKVRVLVDETISTVTWQAGVYRYLGLGSGTGFDGSDWEFLPSDEGVINDALIDINREGVSFASQINTLNFSGFNLVDDGNQTVTITRRRTFQIGLVRSGQSSVDWLSKYDNTIPTDDSGVTVPFNCRVLSITFSNGRAGSAGQEVALRCYFKSASSDTSILASDTMLFSISNLNSSTVYNYLDGRNWSADVESQDIQLTTLNKYAFRFERISGVQAILDAHVNITVEEI